MWDTRLEEGGELNVECTWKGESKRSASSQMQKWEKKGKLPPFSAIFFFSMVFCFCVFFFLLEKKTLKKTPSSSSFIFLFLFETKKAITQACFCLLFLLFFVYEQGNNNKFVIVPKFSPPTFLLHFIVCSLHHYNSRELEAGGQKKEGKMRN